MGLSEEDRKRIEEEELRRALREKYERELRASVDVRADTRHQVDVRGVSTEIYRDAKQGVSSVGRGLAWGLDSMWTGMCFLLWWIFIMASTVFLVASIVKMSSYMSDLGIVGYILLPVSACVLGTLIWWKWFRRKRG